MEPSSEVQITELLLFQGGPSRHSHRRTKRVLHHPPKNEKIKKQQLPFEPMLSRAERAASSAGAKSTLSGPKSWIKGLGLGRALVSHWPRRLRMDEALLAPPEGELTQRAVWPAALLNHLQFIPVATTETEEASGTAQDASR